MRNEKGSLTRERWAQLTESRRKRTLLPALVR